MKTTAQEIMSTEILKAHPKMTVEEVLRILVNSRITGLPVVDPAGKMVGVVSEYDIIQQFSENLAKPKSTRDDIFQMSIQYTPKARSVHTSTPLRNIVKRFIKYKYRRLPVVDDNGALVGIITRRDLMRVFYYRAKLNKNL